MPFDLVVSAGQSVLPAGRHRLVLALEGAVRIDSGPGAGEVVPEGRAGVWAPGEADAVVTPQGTAVIVTGDG
jgi:hypothetical protein